MSKIQDYISKTGVKPSECLYHTWRDVKSSSGKMGKIRVLVPKADGIARCEYTCPECGHSAYIEAEWKRPFSVKCEKCSCKISVPKMKQAFKKEMKAENAIK